MTKHGNLIGGRWIAPEWSANLNPSDTPDGVGDYAQGGAAEMIDAAKAVSPEGEVQTILDGICVSNSLAFAPGGRTAWFADSMKRCVDRYSVDIATGRFLQRALHLDCSGIPGIPDGSCLDSRGRLWTAFYGGGRVVCSTHDGKVAMEIMLPASQPTCIQMNEQTPMLEIRSGKH